MNAHVRRVTHAADGLMSIARPAKHHLATVNTSKIAQRLVVFTPTAADIDLLLQRARDEMGEGAATEVVHRVFRHNPDSFWAIARRENFASGAVGAEGYLAFLMLNQAGMERLFDGSLVATNPDLALLCRQHEIPAGIYAWGLYARGVIAGGIPLAFEKVCTPRYRDAIVYARAATARGSRILEGLGFTAGAGYRGKFLPNLYMFQRGEAARHNVPAYDTYIEDSKSEAISVTIARSLEDLVRVISVRSAVYIGEQQCPYSEEFDGNDLAGINLLGYAGNEPVGCLRVRCFAGFAKLERLAVRREFRKLRLGTKLMQAGVEFCRAKGYRWIYGRAEKNLLDYYLALGWRPLGHARRVVFSDHEYVEIVFEASPSSDGISLETDPYILMRPEGRWHLPGVLERSASRPVRRPSAERTRA
jgi:predicted GNAT family N-acyltransferase